jgi:hypothetical protein
MNWRIFLLLIPVWAVIATIALGGSMSFWETVWAAVIGGVILSLVGFACIYVKDWVSRLKKKQMFSCCFVDHDPPGSSEMNRFDFYPIPIGESQHWLKVLTSEGLNLTDFGVRFVSKEESERDPDDRTQSPEDITSIMLVQNVDLTPEILAQGVKATQTPDRHGGIDIKLDPPYAFGTNRSLFLLIQINARQLWTGKISFRGYDKDLCPRYARTDVTVTDRVDVQPVKKYPVQCATVLALWRFLL